MSILKVYNSDICLLGFHWDLYSSPLASSSGFLFLQKVYSYIAIKSTPEKNTQTIFNIWHWQIRVCQKLLRVKNVIFLNKIQFFCTRYFTLFTLTTVVTIINTSSF